MKRINLYKLLHLILLVGIALWATYIVHADRPLASYIFSNKNATTLVALFWAVLLLSFVFLVLDFNFFSSLRAGTLKQSAANGAGGTPGAPPVRSGWNTLLEKYRDAPAPRDMAVLAFQLFGVSYLEKAEAEELRHLFSTLLTAASLSLCYTGRGEGDGEDEVWLAVFESSTETDLERFQDRVEQKLFRLRDDPRFQDIQYRIGIAVNQKEHRQTLSELAAISKERTRADCN